MAAPKTVRLAVPKENRLPHAKAPEQASCGQVTAEFVIEGLKEVVRKSLASDDEDGKFNATGANKALELLGRYIGIFGDKGALPVTEEPAVDVSGLTPEQLMELAKTVFGDKRD